MYKNNKGITLLALCVTIAVMLILAGVVVNSLTGNNGLIKVARDTADNVVEEDEAGESQRNSIYSEITAEKDDLITTGAFVTDLQVTANNQTKTISATASVTNQEILSYTFYIKKTTYDDKAYVKIEKADRATSTITKKVEDDAVYQIKVVAINKEGKKGTAIQKIVVGDVLKLNVASTTGADSYPDVLLVTAESLENYIDYI
jgi:type II secretory pathway pseudopilin PulG